MIVPNGKRRNQINQGGLKHETIWDSSFFTGAAGDLVKEALAPVSPPGETEAPETPEAQAMGDSNSARMNPKRIPPQGELKGKPVGTGMEEGDSFAQDPVGSGIENPAQHAGLPPGAKFDPMTGEPLMGVDGTKLIVMLKKWLAGQNETSDLEILGFNQKGQQYTITIGPKGKLVSKGGGV